MITAIGVKMILLKSGVIVDVQASLVENPIKHNENNLCC